MITFAYILLACIGNGIGIALVYYTLMPPRPKIDTTNAPRPNVRKES